MTPNEIPERPVVRRFRQFVDEVVLARHDALHGMPLCPYAGKAFRQGKVWIEELPYRLGEPAPVVERLVWFKDRPQYDVLILLHPGVPCDAAAHRAFEAELRPLAARLDHHTFGYHPDDPTSVGGTLFSMPCCGLQFQPEAMVVEARRFLLRRSRYYDRFSGAELKDLNFFDDLLKD